MEIGVRLPVGSRRETERVNSQTPFDFLKVCDPILGTIVEQVGPLEERTGQGDHFAALCHIIIGQQLSVASAQAIRNRFEAHFGEQPSPAKVRALPEEEVKPLGLSGAKARYLRSLASHVEEGQLEITRLEAMSDDEIRTEIVAVNGLGPWSADMFLMFHLNREDVLPVGDLGIREAMRRLYQLDSRPGPAEMEKISQPWRPHRTLACRYLWASLDLAKEKK
ncbi:DNA-3-methyladenine glycosylase [Abditibacteriota bacterium]|nr:DNA-3-methyladenine glycosylase [Abditibacteriota bacterium]